jgi:hypothetical protein
VAAALTYGTNTKKAIKHQTSKYKDKVKQNFSKS